jgi:putative membrane protein
MPKKKTNKTHILLLMVTIIVFIWSAIKPLTYSDWILEVSPAVVAIIIVITTYNKFRMTTLSYFIICILAILTFIGGHYTYAKVPAFDWLKDHFDLQRNHYDRFGHFMKGLLVIIIRELLLKLTPLTKGKWLFFITISIALATSAFYEIVEWIFTKIAHGGKTAKDFLGTQGDIWDAQWDMVLDLIGSILAYWLLSKLHNRLLKKQEVKK